MKRVLMAILLVAVVDGSVFAGDNGNGNGNGNIGNFNGNGNGNGNGWGGLWGGGGGGMPDEGMPAADPPAANDGEMSDPPGGIASKSLGSSNQGCGSGNFNGNFNRGSFNGNGYGNFNSGRKRLGCMNDTTK